VTISVWDAAAIAGWIVVWLMAFMIVIGSLGAISKKRRQRNEVYDRLRKAVHTQDEFERIVRQMKDGETQ
jgi:hypothetical protein